ncbi:MBL fold metallo-hydrolase [Mucisphaera calidilacus]|uniref:N-acyl homoserine lactonase n=1 Tax=Mucisphaera calidilacus TaxID=2527982 RepID=A0A518BV84_9BACT|nr:MBL fold metallo-hydrolase [Mucisphaera calidilacus]QDU70892.1 N-acyl homoserine lactonase [Mucisphaera calidilacus]
MTFEYRIISIGALSVHELWKQQGPARTPHATCTLIRTENRTILVDPGLPPEVITARLAERSGLTPADISDVFLTNFRPAHRWGLLAFPNAKWLIAEAEREAVGNLLVQQFQEAPDDQTRETLRQEIALLQRFEAAPDQVAPRVDLFPLPGYTPGTCGLLLPLTSTTILVAGDAVASAEHLEQGRVQRAAFNIEQARESLAEAIEIADVIIPGHDNMLINPTRRPMG